MSVLALSTDDSTFWMALLGVAALVVFVMIALVVTLLLLIKSITGSVQQLREVAREQAAYRIAVTSGHLAQNPAGPAQGGAQESGQAAPDSADGEPGEQSGEPGGRGTPS